jgi:aryl-alcohol dehydrogenase-like predicted oxidoreductase
MKYARLGSSGLQVSRIGLGMMSYGDPASVGWFLDEDAAEPIVRRAVEGGVTFFDTADMYSDGASEEITGRLLRKLFAHRDDYVLATKVYYPTGTGPNDRGLSRKHIMAAVDASLRRLGTDHIDLYQVHRWDDTTPIAETMDALQDLVRAGKVRYLGASLMRAWQFATAQATGPARFVSMQTRYNLVYREEEREMLPLCAHQGVGVLPYSPLARGLLARGPLAGGPLAGGPLAGDPLAGDPVTGSPCTRGPVTSDPLTGSPLTRGPVTSETLTRGRVTSDPVTSDPPTRGPVTSDPLTRGPVTSDPVTSNPLTRGPVTSDPVTNETLTRGRVTGGSVTGGSVTGGSVTGGPFAGGPFAGGGPLTGGGVTARAAADQSARSRLADGDADVMEALHRVAAARGLPPARIALAWMLGKAAVTAPIIGATKPQHLDDALAAVDLHLTDAEVAAMESPYQPHEPYGYT